MEKAKRATEYASDQKYRQHPSNFQFSKLNDSMDMVLAKQNAHTMNKVNWRANFPCNSQPDGASILWFLFGKFLIWTHHFYAVANGTRALPYTIFFCFLPLIFISLALLIELEIILSFKLFFKSDFIFDVFAELYIPLVTKLI